MIRELHDGFHISVLVDQNTSNIDTPSLALQLQKIEHFVKDCRTLRIKIMTIYLFAAKQWVDNYNIQDLQEVIAENLASLTYFLKSQKIQFRRLGISSNLPDTVEEALRSAEMQSSNYDSSILYLFLNYGDRAEIVEATKRIIQDGIPAEDVNTEKLIKYLYPFDTLPPNLLLDTSADNSRPTNLILWDSPQTIRFRTGSRWTEINKQTLKKALQYYTKVRELASITDQTTHSSSN